MNVDSVTFRKEYHLDPMWFILLPSLAAVCLIIPLCFLLLPLLNIKTTGTPAAYIGMFVLFYPFAGLALYDLFRYRLIITAEGIKCLDWLSTFQIEWSDIVKIEHGAKGYLLITQQPIRTSNPLVTFGRSLQGMSNSTSLSYYMWRWEHNGLKEDFQKYAPHLFSN
jgi:hypothetical protein